MPNIQNIIPVTVLIPVKNEEANLPNCLDQLADMAEVILLDSGSTDNTLKIAEDYGISVLQFAWTGQYPKKRNWYLLNHIPSQPWVLFLDADEVLTPDFISELRRAVADENVQAYWLNFTNYFLDQQLNYGLPQRKLALFRFGAGLYERIEEDGWSNLDMEVHEHPIIEGKTAEIRAPIKHRDYKGITKFLIRHCDYAQWEAQRYLKLSDNPTTGKNFTSRQRFKYRHLAKWWYPVFYFFFTYFVKRGILDGAAGFHYAAYKAWYFRTIRLLIQELEKQPKLPRA